MHPKTVLLPGVLSVLVLIALPIFADSPNAKLAQGQAPVQKVAEALELQVPPALERGPRLFSTDLAFIVAPEQTMSSVQPTSSSGDWQVETRRFTECVQGTRCNSFRDPACGTEGFCNLPSRCCMCF